MSQTVKLKGNDVAVNGVFLQAGTKAKPFTLVTKDLSEATLETYAGKRKILNIFPSVEPVFVRHQFASSINWLVL